MSKIIRSITLALLLCGATSFVPAAGQHGGGGGGNTTPSFAGNWSGTITTSFGTGLFTMAISQSGTGLGGSVHFGAPIFDATLKLGASLTSSTSFAGYVTKTKGGLPITGTISADGKTITGTVIQGQTYTYTVTRQ